jgi:hypothetical protein
LRTRVAANGKTVTKREEREKKETERERKKNEALSSQSFGCTRRWQKALQFRGLVKSSEIAVAQSAYNTQPVITCGSVARCVARCSPLCSVRVLRSTRFVRHRRRQDTAADCVQIGCGWCRARSKVEPVGNSGL